MVEFSDGSIKAQMGEPDMKVPIQFALSYPERYFDKIKRFSFINNNNLTFEDINVEKFPCIQIAKDALLSGGSHQVVLNIANDEVVAKFLNNEISFMDIPKIIEKCINNHNAIQSPNLDEIKNLSIWAKEYINREIIV
tara:strand:- start:274 stop:687 length:414 start_codon:yes stop_codon:yes gene_type:complete